MKTAHAAAVMTWIYAAGFGGTAIPVAAYLKTRGHLPTFMGMFEMYGGPRLAHVQQRTFIALLAAFFGVTMLAALSAWWVWRGRKSGAVLNLSLLPIEAIFWLAFALPFPWLSGVARAVLLLASWRSLSDRGSERPLRRSPSPRRTPLSLGG
jgi:hypothetical protein